MRCLALGILYLPLAPDLVCADADAVRVAEGLLSFRALHVVLANVCLVVLIPIEQVASPDSLGQYIPSYPAGAGPPRARHLARGSDPRVGATTFTSSS
jgi:hypothetical protein